MANPLLTIRLQTLTVSVCLLAFLVVPEISYGQSGSRAGLGGPTPPQELPELPPQVAQSFIVVDGSAVIRVKPTQARIVLALTTQAELASECKKQMSQKMSQLQEAWIAAGIPKKNIVEDFISVLPRYDFEIKNVDGKNVAMEKKIGYLMQSNIHLAVEADDAILKKVLDVAFENDATDIIGFDLWSKDLDQKKNEARELAVASAKKKSGVLLDAVFVKRPPVINISEKTKVHFPTAMYRSFENASSAQYSGAYRSRRDIPKILLPRSKNTYYHGHVTEADLVPKDLQMRAEISVESHVKIYYQSPAAESFNASRK